MGSAWWARPQEERAKKSKVITSVINLVPMKVMDWKQTDLFLLILLWLWQEFRRVMNLLFYRTSSLLEYVHHSSKCLLHKGVTLFHREWQLWSSFLDQIRIGIVIVFFQIRLLEYLLSPAAYSTFFWRRYIYTTSSTCYLEIPLICYKVTQLSYQLVHMNFRYQNRSNLMLVLGFLPPFDFDKIMII